MLVLLTISGSAFAAGTIGEPRTIDVNIKGSSASSVIVHECEGMSGRATSLELDACPVIGMCMTSCSLPVADGGPIRVPNAYGTTDLKILYRWLLIEAQPEAGFGVATLGAGSTGMRNKHCFKTLPQDPTTCLLGLASTPLVDPFTIEFRPLSSLVTSTRDIVVPTEQADSPSTVRLTVSISRLLEPRINRIITRCTPVTGGAASTTTLRPPFPRGGARSASYRSATIRIQHLEAGTTYRCSMGVGPAALGAKEIHFNIGTTGGSGSGGGSAGGSGGGSSSGAKPIGPIGL